MQIIVTQAVDRTPVRGHIMYLFNIYEKPETFNIDPFDNYLRIRYI